MAGLEVLAGALALTAVLALLHRRHDGRLRQTRAVARATRGAEGQGAEGQGAEGQGAEGQGAEGRGAGEAKGVEDAREDLRPLLTSAGQRATLVQFSSAFCAPCRATKRILGEVAEHLPGVEHIEIDAESNLELVRRLNILKTPTTLVLDAGGREVLRATGQPRKADVVNALGQAVPS